MKAMEWAWLASESRENAEQARFAEMIEETHISDPHFDLAERVIEDVKGTDYEIDARPYFDDVKGWAENVLADAHSGSCVPEDVKEIAYGVCACYEWVDKMCEKYMIEKTDDLADSLAALRFFELA